MGLLSLFRRKHGPSESEQLSPVSSPWQETTFTAAETFREPLSPLTGLISPSLPPLERPQSFSQADMQTMLAKLETVLAKLEQMAMRLDKIEQALRLQQPQQPVTYQSLRRW